MASYSFLAPRPTNAILSDVDHIREIQGILAQLNPSLADDAPEDSKRLVPLDSAKTQYRFERLVGSNWNSVGKLMHDVDTLDGFHASISAVKNTIPVYNADAQLVGDLTGNANTATTLKNIRKLQIGGIASGGSVNFDGSADATIEITQLTVNNANDTAINGILTIKHGGTGGADAATARANLGVPAIDHSSTAKTFGVASTTKYGHSIGSDAPNSTFTADKGYFFSPKGADDLATALRSELDSGLGKKLSLSGGTLTGGINTTAVDILSFINTQGYINLNGGDAYSNGATLTLYGKDHTDNPGHAVLRARDNTNQALLRLTPDGSAKINANTILTSAGGTILGEIRFPEGAVRYAGKTFVIEGANSQGTGPHIQFNNDTGDLWLVSRDNSAGWRQNIQITRDAIYANGSSILTSAGGIAGWLTIQNLQNNESGYLYASDKSFWVGGRTADGRDSSFIRFYHLDDPNEPGAFMISTRAADGGWGAGLFGSPNGNLWWNNSQVITSAGGTLNGQIFSNLDDILLRSVNDARLVLLGGPDWTRTSCLELYGGDNGGFIILNANNGTYATNFRVEPTGTAFVNNVPIRTVVAFYNDGYNWYRKYSDNWLEQGGLLDANRSGTITFPLPFTYGPTTCVISGILTSYSRNDDGGIYINSYPSTTSFSYSDNGDASSVRCYWYACGV